MDEEQTTEWPKYKIFHIEFVQRIIEH